MILSLHVRNLALIEEEEVSFTDGLNILTGETGAGKSIIIGSINLAIGARADKAIIRTGEKYALVEMVFQIDNDRQLQKLQEMDLPAPEDGTILIKRKIMANRSICSVNGETVTMRQLRELGEVLIDVYGQRENQRLLRREAQLQTLDDFGGERIAQVKSQVKQSWKVYRSLREQWNSEDMDAAARQREIDLLTFEVNEIEAAALQKGEDEELEEQYRKLASFRKISEAAGAVQALTGEDEGAGSMIERACREFSAAGGCDSALDALASQLSEIDCLLSDFNRSLSDYVLDLTFDPQQFAQIEERLDEINHLKDKYGGSIESVNEAMEKKQERLDFLADYEQSRAQLQQQMEAERARLVGLCQQLSDLRFAAGDEFAAKMREQLMELNFNQVVFQVDLTHDEKNLSGNGWDKAAFYISMNPGESPRPLEQIASGGELSRIMLALKTVFAGMDEIHSFIFDEIDTGISGQTAWKVSEKLGRLARNHQILCITHLPQIASMEDSHFRIRKDSGSGRTITHITRLSEQESDDELGRLLGGAKITEATLQNAREMKEMAAGEKLLAG